MTRKQLLRIGSYGTIGVVLLLVLLDPYSRQSIFGPTIQGEPLCYWQWQIRRGANPNAYHQSVVQKALGIIGIRSLSDDTLHISHANELRILTSLTDDSDAEVRTVVARGLVFHRETIEATDALIWLLDDSDPRVRAAAAFSCTADGPSLAAANSRLQQLLDDENVLCRTSAAVLVSGTSNPRHKKALGVLVDALHASEVAIRLLAVDGLCDAASDFPESFGILCDAASRDPDARARFAYFGSKFGPMAVPLLTGYLRDSDSQVRCAAAYALGNLGTAAKSVEPALAAALNDPEIIVQRRAREALSTIDPERYPEKKSDRKP
jgi:HEAT repeat protein